VSNSLGMASSPLVVNDVLVSQVENDSESYTVGLDLATGRNRWRLDRPKAANWTSPVVIRSGGRSVVALQSSKGITAIDPAKGEEVWSFSDGASTIPSSCVSDGVIYIPSNGITALKPRADGNTPEQLWISGRLQPATASPIVVGSRVYTVNRAGVLTAGAVKDGERLWQLRLKGSFSATPVAAGKHLYFFSETGLMQVVDTTAPEGKVVGNLNLEDQILGTPAAANGALYVRSNTKLYKVAR